jgi:hypothetical protein
VRCFISSVRSRFEPSSSHLTLRALLFLRTSSYHHSCPSSPGKPSQPRVSKPTTQAPKFAISSDSHVQTRIASGSARFLSSSPSERVCCFSRESSHTRHAYSPLPFRACVDFLQGFSLVELEVYEQAPKVTPPRPRVFAPSSKTQSRPLSPSSLGCKPPR